MEMTKELAELTGIMCGDGCLSSKSQKYVVYISGHKYLDFDYHNKCTRALFLRVFGKNIKINHRSDENTLFIRFSDEKVFNVLNSVGLPIGKKYDNLKVPTWINKNPDFAVSFVRGLTDTDGCVVFSKQHRSIGYYPRIEIASKSISFLEEVFSILVSNGFYGSVSKKGPHYRLEIPGFKNLDRWLKLIGFNNPKHIRKIEAHMGPITPLVRLELTTP